MSELTTNYQRGLQLYESGQIDELEELLVSAFEDRPDDGRRLELQGLLWHGRRRFASANRAFELASMLVPLSLVAQLAMADSYRRCGKADDARTILSFLSERSDMPTGLLPSLTAGLGAIGEYQVALDVCREASRREPERDEPLYGMAYYMNRLGYPPEVILPLLRRTVSLAPECGMYRTSLAVMCGRAGCWDEAYELFGHVSPDEVHCKTCIQFMVQVYERMGDHSRRDACLCRLLKLVRQHEALRSPGAERGDNRISATNDGVEQSEE